MTIVGYDIIEFAMFLDTPNNINADMRVCQNEVNPLCKLVYYLLPLGVIVVAVFLYHDAGIAHDFSAWSGGRGIIDCGDAGGGAV